MGRETLGILNLRCISRQLHQRLGGTALRAINLMRLGSLLLILLRLDRQCRFAAGSGRLLCGNIHRDISRLCGLRQRDVCIQCRRLD